MESWSEMWRAGGWGMFPTLGFGIVLLVVAARYAALPERRLVPLIVGTGMLTLLAGLLGFVTGLIATCRYVTLETRPTIVVAGIGESLVNVALALSLVVLAA